MRFGQRVAEFARSHTGCSEHRNLPLYIEAVVPLEDRTPTRLGYYVGNPRLSTCALFATQCLAAGGFHDKTTDGHYVIGAAVANVENEGVEHHALEWGTPDEPFAEGDIVIIDGPPYGPHVVVITSDAEVRADGTWVTRTAEGGQADGGVEAFERLWHRRAGRVYCGDGLRSVVAVLRARKVQGFDDDVRIEDDKARRAEPEAIA